MSQNKVTLYSNGIGHFYRTYTVGGKEPTKIQIPFRKDYIGDVLTSLAVFGKVKMVSPPSFVPANANATKLQVDANNALRGLLKGLSGAHVNLKQFREKVLSGSLLGIEVTPMVNGSLTIHEDFVVVCLDDGSISRVRFSDLQEVSFTEESVQAEIKKALKNNFQKIKPDSTFLEVVLLSQNANKEETAVLQYTQPVAAWKMTYSIRQEQGRFVLEGSAVVDNNTDEDWDNFTVSVATGNPISFSTDIANVVVPNRPHVSVVEGSLPQVQDDFAGNMEMAVCASNTIKGAMRGLASYENYSQRAAFGMARAQNNENEAMEHATVAAVDAKEVGDFCVFTSTERINLASKQSAVIPMFQTPLKTAGSVLLYKESSNARRPFRAVKFKNETSYSLGKGKTVIYQDGVFLGECILESAKPGDQRTLAHCLENGVKVSVDQQPLESRKVGIRFKSGTALVETISVMTKTYTFENRKDENFNVVIDHIKQLSSPSYSVEGVELADSEKLPSGQRLYFTIQKKQTLKITVKEIQIDNQEQRITGGKQFFLNLVNTQESLLNSPAIQACLSLQENLSEIETQIKNLKTRCEQLVAQSARVQGNLANVKKEGNTYEKWIADLDATESEIRKIQEESIPNLEKSQENTKKRLDDAITNLTDHWSERAATATK